MNAMRPASDTCTRHALSSGRLRELIMSRSSHRFAKRGDSEPDKLEAALRLSGLQGDGLRFWRRSGDVARAHERKSERRCREGFCPVVLEEERVIHVSNERELSVTVALELQALILAPSQIGKLSSSV